MNEDKQVREINALLRLLDEPDNNMFAEIGLRIQSFGMDVIPYLEVEQHVNTNPLVQKRLPFLIRQIRFNELKADLQRWFHQGSHDLLMGSLIVARYAYPELVEDGVVKKINAIRKDIWLELNENLTPLEAVRVFNHVFYGTYGFGGNIQEYHLPDNSYLNRVIETGKGNPLSLCIIYMIIGQGLDMPVFGVNLPEHFLLAYTGELFDLYGSQEQSNDILFFIDAFSGGNVLSIEEVSKFIRQQGHTSAASFFSAASNQQIMMRMLGNLVYTYRIKNMEQEAQDMLTLRQSLINEPQ